MTIAPLAQTLRGSAQKSPMLAPLATLLVGTGSLIVLACNALSTGFMVAPPPRGERVVGLMIPLIALVLGGLLIVAGSIVASFRPGRVITDVLPLAPGAAGVVTVGLSLVVSVTAVLAFILWAEPLALGPFRAWRPLLCWCGGLIAPALFVAILSCDLWSSSAGGRAKEEWTTFGRAMVWMLPLVGVILYLAVGFLLGRPLHSFLWAAIGASRPMVARHVERAPFSNVQRNGERAERSSQRTS